LIRDVMPPELDDGVARLRVPPHSTEAEQSVLGGLLLDNAAFDRVADTVTAESFYEHHHRRIFGTISGLIAAGKEADVITVFERLGAEADTVGGIGYINALAQSVPSSAHIARYAAIVREKATTRALIAVTDEAAATAWGDGMAGEKLDRIGVLFDRLQRDQVVHKPREAGPLMAARVAHYTALEQSGKPTGAATGVTQLDVALNGGLQDGRVYVLAARPSIGKTALAIQIGLHRAKAGDGVLLLSQEMPAEECIDRAACNLGGVDYGRMQRGELNAIDWSGVSIAEDEISRMPLWIDDEAGLTIAAIRGKALSLRRQGLKLLIVDYLQLCSGTNPGRGTTRNTEIEEISRGLKTLAKQLRISILLLSQLSREVEKRQNPEPTLADLRDSGAIEQDADCVLFLWLVRTWTDRKIIGLGVSKNRQGTTGQRIPLEFRGELQRWSDSTADISPQKTKRASDSGGFE
jgi:replicative DNA helicase